MSLKSNDYFQVVVDELVDGLSLGITHLYDKILSIKWLYFGVNYFFTLLTAKVNMKKATSLHFETVIFKAGKVAGPRRVKDRRYIR